TVRLDAVKSSAVSIKVMDVNGRTLIEKPIHGLDEVSLDLSEMSNGIYIIQIVTSKAVLTKEIIIQR
ncbi:MAG: T9SS type A sorting domain-containing protein, partial [Bacteroidetes bacterium]|nr:T9SS type A sorting domain-containing protein [Bacteroidota bacterium]